MPYGEVYSLSTLANYTDKGGLRQRYAVPPISPLRNEIGSPTPRRPPSAVIDPNPPLWGRHLCFHSEELTMTTYDHINELRAELAASIDQAERQQIAAELASAEAKLAEEDAAFEALISDEPPH